MRSNAASAQTPTSSRGVTVVPRLPDFEFLDSTPRLWFGGLIGPTALYNVMSVIATEVETFFIRDGRELLKEVKNPVLRREMQEFLRQEANHSLIHARYNRLLTDRGYPVEETRRAVQKVLGRLGKTTSLQTRIAVVIAGEHILAELGMPIIENPDMMKDADPVIRNMFEWHLYEEQEHKSVVMDAYREVYGDGLDAYANRMRAVPITLSALYSFLVPSIGRFMRAELHDSARVRREWRSLLNWMFLEPGYFRTFAKRMLAFARPDFHPWKFTDNAGELDSLRKRMIRDDWVQAPRGAQRTS